MGIWILKDGKTIKVSSFTFPGGEIHSSIHDVPRTGDLTVIARIQSSDTILQLLQASEILDREHFGYRDLVIPYFPYARQDRVTAVGDTFSLKPIANVLNTLPFRSVTVIDPHSDVTPALLNRCRVVKQWEVIDGFAGLKTFAAANMPLVISPDAGAAKKASQVSLALNSKLIVAAMVCLIR